jgi:hypothetical protein
MRGRAEQRATTTRATRTARSHLDHGKSGDFVLL